MCRGRRLPIFVSHGRRRTCDLLGYIVLRGGKVLARSDPARRTVIWDGIEEQVTFMRE